MIRMHLRIDLSPIELRNLSETLTSLYSKRGVKQGGVVMVDRATFVDFLS